MKILNFNKFSLCYSAKRKLAGVGDTGESGLLGVAYARGSKLTGVTYTEDSTQKIFSHKITGVGYTRESVGYTGESGLTGMGYTGESKLPGVAYTGESLVQTSRPANALKGTIP